MKRRTVTRRKSAIGLSKRFRPLSVEALEARMLLAVDFGDAPSPYPTTVAEDGARHSIESTREATKLGSDIFGTFKQNLGYDLALNELGTVVVASGENGEISVFEFLDDLWTQVGQNIPCGGRASVAINRVGDVIAFRDPYKAGILRYNGIEWLLMGSEIPLPDGIAGYDAATSIALNGTGDRVIIGSPRASVGALSQAGTAHVFEYANGNWSPVGDPIVGIQERSNLGYSVDMSSGGDRISVAAPREYAVDSYRGRVEIFELAGTNWSQIGNSVLGEYHSDSAPLFGAAHALSATGEHLIIAEPRNGSDTGSVMTYQYATENQTWVPRGNTLVGDEAGAGFGISLDISGDGNRIVVGAEDADNNFQSRSGYAQLFEFDGSTWQRVGQKVSGDAHNALYGFASAISENGEYFATTSTLHSGNGIAGTGKVIAFSIAHAPSLSLGVTVTTEPDAEIGADQGDDGVTFFGNIQGGDIGSVEVSIHGAEGYLDAWFDFNQDGNWYGVGEQIFSSQKVLPGINTLEFNIPANVVPGQTHARFRLSESGGLLPTGLATSGEVEDYSVIINSMQMSSVRSQSVAVSIENARLKATDTLTLESILDIPESDVPAELLFFGDDGNENAVIFDQLSPATLQDGYSPRTFRFDGGQSQNNTATINTGDAHWAWISSQPSVSQDTTIAVMDRTNLLDTYVLSNLDRVIINNADRIAFTDPYFEIGQQSFDINASKPLNLPTDTTITGGSLSSTSSLGLHTAESLVGHGTVTAPFAGTRGSLIESTGPLIIGDATSSAGFNTDGLIEVGQHSITLNDANEATLGELLTLGTDTEAGNLIAQNGLTLNFGRNIEGYGTVDTTTGDTTSILLNNGSITGNSPEQPITLTATVKGVGTMTNVVLDGTFTPGFSPTLSRNGDVVYGDRNTIEIELGGHLPGSEHDRIEHQSAFLDGKLEVLLIDGYTPLLGTELEILKSATDFQGAFDLIDVPEFLHGLRIEEVLDASTMTLEAVFDVADELHVVQTSANTFEIADWDGTPLKVLGSTFRARVAPDDQFRSEDSWINDGHFMKGETLVQTVTDGINRIEIEGSRWKNFVSPYDITNDGKTSVLDALTIINELARGSFVDLDTNQLRSPSELSEWPGIYYDTNGDDRATVLDALLVINELARTNNDNGEGELTDAAIQNWSRDLTRISPINQPTTEPTESLRSPSIIFASTSLVDHYVSNAWDIDAECQSIGSDSLKTIDESILSLLSE